MNQQELLAIRKIRQESEYFFDIVFDGKFIKYNEEIEYIEQHDRFSLDISYLLKNNIMLVLHDCSIFLHPQGGLQFACNVYLKNNNPAPDENYYKDSFFLKDYTTFRKIPFDWRLTWKPVINYEDGIQVAKKLFESVKGILLLEEMQKILFTDYWVNVPIDYSPYK